MVETAIWLPDRSHFLHTHFIIIEQVKHPSGKGASFGRFLRCPKWYRHPLGVSLTVLSEASTKAGLEPLCFLTMTLRGE